MMSSLILLLVLVVAIGGIGMWMQRSRAEAAPLQEERPEPPTRRVSLLMEAVGYIGTILVLAGASAAIGQRWDDIGTWGRIAILGGATLLFLGIGLVIRASAEPAFRRLTGVTWAVSVAALAGTVGVLDDHYDASDRTTFLTVATVSTAYAAVLYLWHLHAVQQAVLFIGVLLSAASVVARFVDAVDGWMIAVPLWAIGVAWAAAGWWRRIPPWFVAVPIGLLAALVSPAFVDSPSGLRFGLGIATAGTVMALSVIAGFTPALAMASIAMLGYVIGAVTYYFGDALGVPASLAIAGLLILALAATAARWHWFGRRRPPTPGPGPGEPPSTQAPPREHEHVG